MTRYLPTKPRLLLLGKNGQVGWELQRALAPLGTVIMHDHASCDLQNIEQVKSVVHNAAPTVIINAAAYTSVDRAETDQQSAYAINTIAVAALAELARKFNALLIHFSTDYVFDGRNTEPYLETDTPNPLSIYGDSKRLGEIAIVDSGCAYLIFRTSWVFAARGTNFAKTMLLLSMEKEQLRVVADQFGAPTSAELIADITAHALLAVTSGQAPAGLYHLAADGETSWHNYASYIIGRARALAAPIKTTSIETIATAAYPLPAKRPASSRLNTEKLKNTFKLTLPHWQYHVERMLIELIGQSNGS